MHSFPDLASPLGYAARYRNRRYPSAVPWSCMSWECQQYLRHGPERGRRTTKGRFDSRCNLQGTSASKTDCHANRTGDITYHTASDTRLPASSFVGTPRSYQDNAACHARPPRTLRNRCTFLAQTAALPVESYRLKHVRMVLCKTYRSWDVDRALHVQLLNTALHDRELDGNDTRHLDRATE